MKYEQGGATFDGKQTKSHLKEVIKQDPHAVYLYSTSAVTQGWKGYADELPDETTFNVVGPDPYTARNWYASVKKNNKGGLTVA